MESDWLASRRSRADLAIFHEFAPPPGGGGHQFLRALERELASRGYEIEENRLSAGTEALLFNSFNYDVGRLRRFERGGVRRVHRVDGPIGVYRGFDDGTDGVIADANREFADATVLQSQFSLDKHRELGIDLRSPVVIPNAVDSSIFHPPVAREPVQGRRVRLVGVSWSDNPRKGGELFAWVDRNLDRERYELTFVGQTKARFEHANLVGPVDSRGVAEILRTHDIYIAASRDDPCSNALLEALACGLPVAFLNSGGHPELVGDGGLPFGEEEELQGVLDRLVAELDDRRAAISIPRIADVADCYLEVLGLGPAGRT
jgi:glycosyltransferase involved in cell wall biosynthesis